MELAETDFTATSFFNTFLRGIDFSNCKIEGIKVSNNYKELYDVIVDVYQAADLAKLLGVMIKR